MRSKDFWQSEVNVRNLIHPLSGLNVYYPSKMLVDRPKPTTGYIVTKSEVEWIKRVLINNSVAVISGGMGVGKTALINKYLIECSQGDFKYFIYDAPVYKIDASLLYDFLWSLLTTLYDKKIPNALREKASNFQLYTVQEQNQFIWDLIINERILIVIDNYLEKYCGDLQPLIHRLGSSTKGNAKMIIATRHVSRRQKVPILYLNGLDRKQLQTFYSAQLERGLISASDVNAIWEKTYGLPLLNICIKKAMKRTDWLSKRADLVDKIFYFDEIQEYLYSLYGHLSRRERKLLGYLMNGGLVNHILFGFYSLFIIGRLPSQILTEYILRSVVYEDEHGVFVPEIAKDFYKFIWR
jgi:hypothetical protein